MAQQRDFTAVMETLERGPYPFVVYRLPGSDRVKVLIDDSVELRVVGDAGLQRGFVFAPFASDSLPAVLLRPAAVTHFPMDGLPEIRLREDATMDYGDEISRKQHYMELVERAKAEIAEGEMKKIVTSRRVEIPYKHLNTAGLFAALARKYPDAFVYFLSHPQIGRWGGASPELLLLRHGRGVHTMSLAGTMPYQGERMYRWSAKNVEEQAIVSAYVKDALERSGVAAVSVSKPENQLAGPVVHLCSRIDGQAGSDVDMNVLLRNLAPTPALCGFPRKEAMEFIRRYEGYPREFYGGYLGELNMDGESSAGLYVNIRCLQVGAENIMLYAGGGIVADSDAESEWDETCRKLDTLAPVVACVAD